MAKKAAKNEFHKYVKSLWVIYISIFGFIFLLFTIISLGWLGFMPSFEDLENPRSNLASEVYSSDQQLLGKYYIENRSNIHFEELSTNVKNAFIATEDDRFNEN